jgi:hypothetical protein
LIPAEAILVRRQAGACPWATGAWGASDDVLLAATVDGRPEPLSRLGEDAGKLADPVPGVPEPDVRWLPPVRSEQLARAEPCTRDAVRCAVRSCAAMVPAVAVGQCASLVSLLPELLAVAVLASTESPQLELRLELWAAAQPADVLVARQAQLAAL